MTSIRLKPDNYRHFKFSSAIFIVLLILGIFLSPSFAVDIQKDTDQNTKKEVSIESIDKTIEKITSTQTDKLTIQLGVTGDQIGGKISLLNALNSSYVRLKNSLLELKKVKKEQQTIYNADYFCRRDHFYPVCLTSYPQANSQHLAI